MGQKYIIACIVFSVFTVASCTKLCCPNITENDEYTKCLQDVSLMNLSCPDGTLLELEKHAVYFYEDDGLHSRRYYFKPEDYCIMQKEEKMYIFTHVDEYPVVCWRDREVSFISEFSTILSVVVYTIVFLLYCWIPQLRDTSGKCVMFYMFHLICAYTGILIFHYMNPKVLFDENYLLLAILILQIFLTSARAWMNILNFQVWRNIIVGSPIGDGKAIPGPYIFWGFLIPIFVTVGEFFLLITYVRPERIDLKYVENGGIVENTAFIHASDRICVFIDFCISCWIIIELFHRKKKGKLSEIRWFSYLGFVFLIDLIDIIYVANEEYMPRRVIFISDAILKFCYVATVVTFLILVRDRTLKGLSDNNVFFVRWPQKWKQLKDEDDVIVRSVDHSDTTSNNFSETIAK